MKPKISVIVPIYNTEKYLDKCLASIVNQTMQEIEIICVDDCSPDDSYLIVEKYLEQDFRVSLIRHEKNIGSGGARNTGILAAKADFLASVDSDDYIKPEMMQTLWSASEDGVFDVVCCGYDRFDEGGNSLFSKKLTQKKYMNINNNIEIFFLMNPVFWNKLWRKSLFVDNSIFFPEKIYNQDLATTPCILAKSKNIRIIEDSLYCYLIRENSASRVFNEKYIIDTFKALGILLDFLEKNNIIKYYKNEFKELVDSTVHIHSQRVLQSNMSNEEIILFLKHMLMLKIGFLTYKDVLVNRDKEALLDFLQEDNTFYLRGKIKPKIMRFLFKPFLTDKQYLKLKRKPRLFFKDSKSIFTRKIGDIFNLA